MFPPSATHVHSMSAPDSSLLRLLSLAAPHTVLLQSLLIEMLYLSHYVPDDLFYQCLNVLLINSARNISVTLFLITFSANVLMTALLII